MTPDPPTFAEMMAVADDLATVDRLADAFGRLSSPERQLIVCALAGNLTFAQMAVADDLATVDRLADAFGRLSSPERQLIVCALAGNHPENLRARRIPVLRGLAKAGGRLTADQRREAR